MAEEEIELKCTIELLGKPKEVVVDSFILPERSFNNACKSVIESFVSFVVKTSIEDGA